MDRRFILVLLVSLLFAAGTTGAFACMSGQAARPGLAAAILAGTLVSVAATLYFALRGSFRERRQVEHVIETQVGTRPWAAMAAEHFCSNQPTGRLITWVVCLAAMAAALLYMGSVTPLLLLVWAALVIRHARAPQESWPNRLGNIASTSVPFLLMLPTGTLPGNPWWFLAAAGAMTLVSVVHSLRTAGTGKLAVAGVENAFNSGDYAGVLKAARGLGPDLAFNQHGELATLAEAHLRRREFAEAEVLWRQALSREGKASRASSLCVKLAHTLIEQRRYDEAAKSLQAAAALSGEDSPTVAEAKAHWCLRQGIEPARALAAADISLRAGTDRAAILRAWALAENGRIDDAREQLKAWTPDEQNTPQRAECAYLAGRALAASGDADAAHEQFRRAIESEPDGLFGHLSREAARV